MNVLEAAAIAETQYRELVDAIEASGYPPIDIDKLDTLAALSLLTFDAYYGESAGYHMNMCAFGVIILQMASEPEKMIVWLTDLKDKLEPLYV
jgi:hypothetical protein